MTPPFQPGDRVTVRYNKPLGVLEVQECLPHFGKHYHGLTDWYVTCQGNGCTFAGPATSLIKVEDNG